MTHWIQDNIYVASKSKIITQSEYVILDILYLLKYILLTIICIAFAHSSVTNNSMSKMSLENWSLRESMCCRQKNKWYPSGLKSSHFLGSLFFSEWSSLMLLHFKYSKNCTTVPIISEVLEGRALVPFVNFMPRCKFQWFMHGGTPTCHSPPVVLFFSLCSIALWVGLIPHPHSSSQTSISILWYHQLWLKTLAEWWNTNRVHKIKQF